MKTRRTAEEMATYLAKVRDFARESSFEAELQLARDEYFGVVSAREGEQVAVHDERNLLEVPGGWSEWFLFHRCHSRADRTLVRMFVEGHPDLPERIRENLLGCEHSLNSVFAIVAAEADHLVAHDLNGDHGDYYNIQRDESLSWVRAGELVNASLLRWDEEYFFYGPVERWPRTPSDVLGHARRPLRFVAGRTEREEAAQRRRGTMLFGNRTDWLRERRRRP